MNAKEIIQEITEKVQKNANVKVVFGDPIKDKETTIIPVATICIRGGGGGGFGEGIDKKDNSKGGGMGLGVQVITRPVGYIEIKNGNSNFVEIIDRTKIILGGIALTAIIGLFIKKAIIDCSKSYCCSNENN